MGNSSTEEDPGLPEKLVARLARLLKRHALWDALLLLFPPLVVFFSFVIFLYRSAWVAREPLLLASATLAGLALLIGLSRLRAVAPPVRVAARLLDERVGGKDRFITLATIQPAVCPPSLLARLRHEAAVLMRRLDLEGDFPYRIKRSFFQSLIGSLSVILLFLLFQQIGSNFAPPAPRDNELALLGQKLSQIPRFSALARSLEMMAARMRDQALSGAEKLSLIRELMRRVESQLAAEQQLGGAANDLLNQAANALRGLEQGLEKGQELGAGGSRDQQSGAGKGSGKESGKGSGGERQDELNASKSRDDKGEKSPLELEKEERAGNAQGGGEQNKGDKPGKDGKKSKDMEGMAKGDLGGKAGSYKYKEEDIPRGAAAERFQKPGEQGDKGIKGARFITVELPEEEVEGQAGQSGSGKRREFRPKTPISNVPLRQPDSPDAAPERQPLPLEYRGLIR